MAFDQKVNEADPQEAEKINEEKLINEEYKVWKKNAPYLYDLVVTHALEWPTLTVQWLPDMETSENKEYTIQRVILGTHTSDGEQNYLEIATVQLPDAPSEMEAKSISGDNEVGRYGGSACRLNITHRINHDGEVNRARYMPQNPCLIATKTIFGEVHIFDYTKHPSKPSNDGKSNPDIKLLGHTTEGYGLAWSNLKKGYLLSSSEEETICLWDVSVATKETKTIEVINSFKAHTGNVGDVSWNASDSSVFASVGDDGHLCIWDIRKQTPIFHLKAHEAEANCVEFNPVISSVLATGSSDHSVALWDMRNLKHKMHSLESHTDEVFQVQWSPHHDYIVASASTDRRINIWDLSKIGDEQSTEDAEDGPPELLFVHGGHTNKISDISWNPALPWTMCSAAEDNICQIWRMVSGIYSNEMEVNDSDVE